MSNFGQAALTIVGTAVGAYFGYPQLGLVLGSLAGNALFPTQLPGITGPKISDLATTSAELGGAVPWIFGTIAVPGTVMYLGPLLTHSSTTHQGKGGPSQDSTQFSYTQSLGVGLCRGIVGLRRVWENGELVYDIRPQLPGESSDAFTNRAKAAATYAEGFVFYEGSETQLPDPTIELDKGVGNVPGFRGLAYIVFPDRALRQDQGLRHPSFRFEVYSDGVSDCEEVEELSVGTIYPWLGAADPTNPKNTNKFNIRYLDAPGFVDTSQKDTLAEVQSICAAATGYDPGAMVGYTPDAFEQRKLDRNGGPTVSDPAYADTVAILQHYNLYGEGELFVDGAPDGTALCAVALSHNLFRAGIFNAHGETYVRFEGPLSGSGEPSFEGYYSCSGAYHIAFRWDSVIQVTRSEGPPEDPCEGLTQHPPGYITAPDGTLIECTNWERVDLTGGSLFKVLQRTSTELRTPEGGEYGTVLMFSAYPLGPVLRPEDPHYSDAAWWTAQYNAAVDASLIAPGKTYGVHYPLTQSYAWHRVFNRCAATVSKVSLAHIIGEICAACGDFPVEVTDLEEVTVAGYAIASVMTGRDALTPLRSVGYWDCVESGKVLKFVRRGKDVVAQIGLTDLGAADATAGDAQPAVTTERMQDVDLPRSIRVHYIAPSRDYGAGQQPSPHRITTRAVNDTDLELAVALDDDQAAQIAEVLWSDAWAGRSAHTINLDRSYAYLEGGDCITVPIDARLIRNRIISISDASALLRKVSLIEDDNESYVSTAVAQPPQIPTSTVKVAASTDLFLLDLPALSDADDDAGFYAVADSAGNGTSWNGAFVFRSIDGSSGWTQLTQIATQAPRGLVLEAVPAGITDTFDTGASINVEMLFGELENRTAADVMAGANAAAIGSQGRWEIIQFTTAVNTADNLWTISGLLRGRRGTEYVMGTSEAGDYFIVLSTGGLARIALDIANIGQEFVYRAVSNGTTFASGIDQTFAGHAQALVPFSPVGLSLDHDDDTDEITFSWIRRGRIGQELRSGADIPLSEAAESYAVEVFTAGSPDILLRTYTVSAPTASYPSADQIADFGYVLPLGSLLRFKVYQISAVVGRGTPAEATLQVGGHLPVPPVVTHQIDITFGGVFNSANDITLSVIFTPNLGGAPVHHTFTLDGTGKAALADYAIDLASQVGTALGSDVTLLRTGANLLIDSTRGSFNASYFTNSPLATTTLVQAAGAAAGGLTSVFYIDLYNSAGLAPDTSSSYNTGGIGLLNLTIHSYDADEENRLSRLSLAPIPSGLQEGEFYRGGYHYTVPYTVDGSNTTRIAALSHLPAAILADPGLGAYVQGATLGQLTGTPDGTMPRVAVSVQMKPGYYLAETNIFTGTAQPSGFTAEIKILQIGSAIYGSPGRKKIVTVQFSDAFDGQTGTYYSVLALGQVYSITLAGNTYSHTADAFDLADPRTDLGTTAYYRDGIYSDLKSQIQAAGFTVVDDLVYRQAGGGGSPNTWNIQLAIYGAGNVNYAAAASVPFDTTVTLNVT